MGWGAIGMAMLLAVGPAQEVGVALRMDEASSAQWRFVGGPWGQNALGEIIWANGAMIEVKPDEVLFLYGGWNNPQQLRMQRLKVTADGLKPAGAN